MLKKLTLALLMGVPMLMLPACDSETENATENAVEKAKENAEEAEDKAENAADKAKNMSEDALEKTRSMAEDTMDKIEAAIDEGRLDDAKEMLGKVEGMLDKLPASMKEKYNSLKATLEAKMG